RLTWLAPDTLRPPAARASELWRWFVLAPTERRRKSAAIETYHTQTAVMGGRLRAFDRRNELFQAWPGSPVLEEGPEAGRVPPDPPARIGPVLFLSRGRLVVWLRLASPAPQAGY